MNEKKEKFYLNNENLPSQTTEFEWTPEMVLELKKCKQDIVYFAEKFFYIVDQNIGKKTIIKLYKAQKRVLKSLKRNSRVALCSSRQIGKTTLMTIFALYETCFEDDKAVLIVANKEKTAKQTLDRIRTAYELLPNWIKPALKEYTKTRIKFANDSTIDISSTSSSTARGITASVLIIDEAAFIPPHLMEQFHESVIPIVSAIKNSKIFLISTPNGTHNIFYDTFTKAERGINQWKAEKIDWWEVPGRDEIWRQKAISDIGSEEAFDREFGNKFIETGESAVDKTLLDVMKRQCNPPTIINKDFYKVWKAPEKGHIYIFGVDVSDGVGSNASVIEIIDITDLTNIEQVAEYCNNKIEPYHFAKEIFDITHQWGMPYIMVERNSMGGQVVDALIYTHKYSKLVAYNADKNDVEKYGVYSHTNSKYESVTNMRYFMNSLQAVKINSIALIQELETFVKYPNGTWKKQGGDNVFDDRVMSFIWALFILHGPIIERYFNVLEYDTRGKPLKIEATDYVDENYYGVDAMTADFAKDDFLPSFIGTKENNNEELDELLSNGWSLFNN